MKAYQKVFEPGKNLAVFALLCALVLGLSACSNPASVDPIPGTETGSLTGTAKYTNTANHSGITVGSSAFRECTSLTQVTCNAVIPPTLEETYSGKYPFDYASSNLVIKVPAASVDEYKAAPGWSEYASKIVGF